MKVYHLITTLKFIGLFTIFSYSKGNDDEATIVFGGDVNFSRGVRYFANVKNGCNYSKILSKVKKYFQDADYSVVNLETPVFSKTSKNVEYMGNKLTFAAEEKSIVALRQAGVKAVSVANNHLYDFGRNGVNSTIHRLRKYGMGIIGVGFNQGELASQIPLIKNIKGIKVGFLGYCVVEKGCLNLKKITSIGPALYSVKVASRDIRHLLLKEKVNCVIIMVHWGIEYVSLPPLFIRKMAQTLLDLGASIIVGSHPHYLQVHEFKRDDSITYFVEYSLGNLVFPSKTSINVFNHYGDAKDPQVFIKSANDESDLTRIGALLKVKIKKGRRIRAWTLKFVIKFNATTKCLQPVPTSGEWIEACGTKDDTQCPNLTNFFSPKIKDHIDVNDKL